MSGFSSVSTKSNCCGGKLKIGIVNLASTIKRIGCDFWGNPTTLEDDLTYGPIGQTQVSLIMEGGASSRCSNAAKDQIISKIKNSLSFENLFNPDGRLKNLNKSFFQEVPMRDQQTNNGTLLILDNLPPEINYCRYSFLISFSPNPFKFQYKCCLDGTISINFNNFPEMKVEQVMAVQSSDPNWIIFPPIKVVPKDPDEQFPIPPQPPGPIRVPIPEELLKNPNWRKQNNIPYRLSKN